MDSLVDTLKKAELGPSEVARLLNLSRVTVSLWMNGHNKPHSLLAHRVDTLQRAVAKALDEDLLPLESGMKRRDRRFKLEDIIDAMLEDMGLEELEVELHN